MDCVCGDEFLLGGVLVVKDFSLPCSSGGDGDVNSNFGVCCLEGREVDVFSAIRLSLGVLLLEAGLGTNGSVGVEILFASCGAGGSK